MQIQSYDDDPIPIVDEVFDTNSELSIQTTYDISFSSHWEAGLIFCCFVIAFSTFIKKRLPGTLFLASGFFLVFLKYAFFYITILIASTSDHLVVAIMALGPAGLGLVAMGLYKQATQSVINRKLANSDADSEIRGSE